MNKEILLNFSTLGERLKYLRGKKTQESISKILDINISTYCKYEKNIVDIDWRKLKKIALLNDIIIDDILKGL